MEFTGTLDSKSSDESQQLHAAMNNTPQLFLDSKIACSVFLLCGQQSSIGWGFIYEPKQISDEHSLCTFATLIAPLPFDSIQVEVAAQCTDTRLVP